MKRCPTCNHIETDDRLGFCRFDGARLVSFDSELPTVVLGSAPVTGVRTRKVTSRGPGSPKSKTIDSIAVLPFENASNDPNTEYLSDGITESIINSLSELPKLRVMARSTVFRYKGQEIDPQRVGIELGVRGVVTGRVLQLDDHLTIGIELVDVTDGSQLWGERYSRQMADIFPLQEEIAGQITSKLRVKLTASQKKRLGKHPTRNSEAYQLYLKGRYFWNKRSEQDLKKAIEYFQQAIEKDPDYALAYTGIADSYSSLAFSFDAGALPPNVAMPKAKAAAVKALEIDKTLSEAHASLAMINLLYDWDWDSTEKEFKLALELNPNNANAHHWYSHYLLPRGRVEESLAESTRALELAPLDLIINVHLGWHYLYTHQYDQAAEQFRKTLELDPSFVQTHWYLGLAYGQKGMYADALAELQKAFAAVKQNTDIEAELAHAYAAAGKRMEAEQILDRLKGSAKQRFVSAYRIATIYAGLGEKDQGLDWLEKAFAERSDLLVYLKVDPKFDNLHSEPRFAELVHRVGLAS